MEIAFVLAESTPWSCLTDTFSFFAQHLEVDLLTLTLFFENGDQLEIVRHFSPRPYTLSKYEFTREILNIYLSSSRTDCASRNPDDEALCITEMDTRIYEGLPKSAIIARHVRDEYRMLLMVHQPAHTASFSASSRTMLHHTALLIAKFQALTVDWLFRHKKLGAPFNQLTEREWSVLRELTTEVGEKQLADKLSISYHTLHTHIKSIYRKLGVRGRHALLTLIQNALTAQRRNLFTQNRN